MIIQFSHDGNDLKLNNRRASDSYRFIDSKSGYRYWNNTNSHKRKFMRQKGHYLRNLGDTQPAEYKEVDIYFWGEWEPQSKFELTDNDFKNSERLPHAVHFPIFSKKGIGQHNTDPFVFGDIFCYTNCKQKKKGKGKSMLSLPQESIIIFGSEINKSQFVVDTVFVVDKSETVAQHRRNKTEYPQILLDATINLEGNKLKGWHRLYKGKMYDPNNPYTNDNPYAFSFVPCKVDCGTNGFARPIIDIKDFDLQKPGAGTVLKKIEADSTLEYWKKLVASFIKDGFYLGVHLEMPMVDNSIDFPEYAKKKKKGCGGC